MMKSLSLSSSKKLLLIIFVINVLILFSYLFFILIGTDLLPINILLLSYPAKIISENSLFLIFFFIIELITIGYFFYKEYLVKRSKIKKNHKKSLQRNDSLESSTEFNVFQHENDGIIDFIDFQDENNETKNELNSEDIFDHENLDLSPTYISDLVTKLVKQPMLENPDTKDIVKDHNEKSPEFLLNDFQYGFYQSLLEKVWVYERTMDRERIKIEHHAIDEAKISLHDIKYLMKINLIYKKCINHPSGKFNVFSVKENIEYEITLEIIQTFLKSNRIKFLEKKIEFQNWRDFGLQRKTWTFHHYHNGFDFYCLIKIFNEINNEEELSNEEILSSDFKDEIKALIATAEIKAQNTGKAFIITNKQNTNKQIEKYIDSTGWGKIYTLDISDKNFFRSLLFFLTNNK